MIESPHLGDRPLLLWSLALGMLGVAFIVSFAGVGAGDDFASTFFRLPFIAGVLVATFVMGFIRPEMRHTWTIGMGSIPGLVLFAVAQIQILFSANHSTDGLWPQATVLALIAGISLAFAGSTLGARVALRLSPN